MSDEKKQALQLSPEQWEQATQALREGGLDAYFVAAQDGEWVFTRPGADDVYRMLIEDMPEGVITLTSEGVIVYANRRFAEMLETPLQRVIGSRLDAWIVPELTHSVQATLAKSQAAKNTLELELLTSNGARLPVLLAAGPLPGAGIPDALGLVVTDLTVQKRSELLSKARQELLDEIKVRARTEETLRMSVDALRLRESALAAVSEGVLISGPDGRTTYVNKAFENITGYTQAEMAGRTCAMLQGPDTSGKTVGEMREALRKAQPFHGELLNYGKDGSPFWNELSLAPVFDEAGNPSQYVGVLRDVTERHKWIEQLGVAARVFEQGSEGIIITDQDNRILRVNPAFTAITGFSEAEAHGRDPRFLGAGQHAPQFFQAMWQELNESGHWQGEVWNRRKDGVVYPALMSLTRVNHVPGKPVNFICGFIDITKRKEDEEKLQRMAHFDQLTGLPNRGLLSDRATQALQAAERNQQSLAVMYLDLDHFKNFNDSLGHRVGDSLLKEVAERLTMTVRKLDTISRVGGDEFVLVLPDTDAVGAARLVDKLIAATVAPMQLEHGELNITASVGIALYPQDGSDFETLCRCADTAMYRAKHDGRNAVRFFTAEMLQHSERVLQIENGLRHAIERNELLLYYQPQLAMDGMQIVGAEALARWQHPQMGFIAPGEFIPIAESCGLIRPIGEWVMRTALQRLAQWIADGMRPITMSVNLSEVQLRQPSLPDIVTQLIEECGVPAGNLELELTESMALNDPLGAIAMMDKLHARGVRLAIDDFGTGYSSLSYLKRFKVNRLKIDQSFVRNLTNSVEDQAIVAAIIGLARNLGMGTIAEGVETEEQLAYLRDAGCDQAQGYWISKPLPAAEFAHFMATH